MMEEQLKITVRVQPLLHEEHFAGKGGISLPFRLLSGTIRKEFALGVSVSYLRSLRSFLLFLNKSSLPIYLSSFIENSLSIGIPPYTPAK